MLQQGDMVPDEQQPDFFEMPQVKNIKYCKIFNWHISFFIPDLLVCVSTIEICKSLVLENISHKHE